MRNKFITLTLILATIGSSVLLYGCNTVDEEEEVRTENANNLTVEDVATPIEFEQQEGTTVVYESDGFVMTVQGGPGGTDTSTASIILGWGYIDDIDKFMHIAQTIYDKYDCGIWRGTDSYEVDSGYVTVYEMRDGRFIECVKFNDGKLNLRDAETAEDFWTSVDYEKLLEE